MINERDFQEIVRHIYCLGSNDFKNIFGEERGQYLWIKYKEDLGGNLANFICYLDFFNLKLLHDHCMEHLKLMKRKVK